MTSVTPRVAQCLDLRASGLLSKQIADVLGIATKTVDSNFRVAIESTESKTAHHLLARYVKGEITVRPARVAAVKKPVKKLPKD